jgi:hypothetical protein
VVGAGGRRALAGTALAPERAERRRRQRQRRRAGSVQGAGAVVGARGRRALAGTALALLRGSSLVTTTVPYFVFVNEGG